MCTIVTVSARQSPLVLWRGCASWRAPRSRNEALVQTPYVDQIFRVYGEFVPAWRSLLLAGSNKGGIQQNQRGWMPNGRQQTKKWWRIIKILKPQFSIQGWLNKARGVSLKMSLIYDKERRNILVFNIKNRKLAILSQIGDVVSGSRSEECMLLVDVLLRPSPTPIQSSCLSWPKR